MRLDQLGANVIIKGPIFPEPVQIIVVNPVGGAFKVIAKGLNTGRVHEPILTPAQLEALDAVTTQSFDGDASRFRLAIEALRLGLAYEYDPYFALSIARVDPLPHQLEAVYDYLSENKTSHLAHQYPLSTPNVSVRCPTNGTSGESSLVLKHVRSTHGSASDRSLKTSSSSILVNPGHRYWS